MAKFLFGPSSMRINIEKAWRHLNKPEPIHGSIEERKQFIYKVKQELSVEDFLRRSNRKMAHGPLRYWKYPVWIIEPKGHEIASSPRHFPVEFPFLTTKNEHFEEEIEKFANIDLQREYEEIEKKYEKEPFMNIKKTMKKMKKDLKKYSRETLRNIKRDNGEEVSQSNEEVSDSDDSSVFDEDYTDIKKYGHLLENVTFDDLDENDEGFPMNMGSFYSEKDTFEKSDGFISFPETKFDSGKKNGNEDKEGEVDQEGQEMGDEEFDENEMKAAEKEFKEATKKFIDRIRNIKREKEVLRQIKVENDSEFVDEHLDFVQENYSGDSSDYDFSDIEKVGAHISKHNDEDEISKGEGKDDGENYEKISDEKDSSEETTDLEDKNKHRGGN